jgi:hypothetical protein
MIEIKIKPCKGIGKANGVNGCGKQIKQRTYGLCNSCLHDFLFETDAGKIQFEKISIKSKSIIKTKNQKETAQKKKVLDGIPKLKKTLETQINTIARLIDKGSGCISCGGQTTPQAGHYHTVQSNGSLRYNLHNLHLQDYSCNCEKSGNIHQYDLGLRERYGLDYWEFVKFEMVKKYPLVKMTFEEYEDKIQIAKTIVKGLEKTEILFNNEQRIMLRNKYNKLLGIYL